MQNALQRLPLLAGNRAITTAVIGSDPVLRQTLLPEERARRATLSIRAGEKEQIQRALAEAHGNRVQAARLLGVSRATLYRKLERHGL